MKRIEAINKLKNFLVRINDVKLSKILGLTYFSDAYSDHLNKRKTFDIEHVCALYKENNVKEKDIITLCKICDFLNRNLKQYMPIIKQQTFDLAYYYSSKYDTNGEEHCLIVKSNFIDLDKLIVNKLSNILKYKKITEEKDILEKCYIVNVDFVKGSEIFDYLTNVYKEKCFVGSEDELDKLVDLFENVSKKFSDLSENYFIVNSIELIVSLLPKDIRNINLINLTRDKKVLDFFKNNNLTKLYHLNKIKYQNTDINDLKKIADILESKSFCSPKYLQNNLLSTLRDKEQKYAELRYKQKMKYKEIGEVVGVTRAGAQSALSKIEEHLKTTYRYQKLCEIFNQILLFRDNDYFISKEIFENLGIWTNLIVENLGLQEYKGSNLYIIENKLQLVDINYQGNIKDADDYEFDFIKKLPTIIKKKELNKFIDAIVENSEKFITRKDIKTIIYLNYIDYNTIISRNKLNISYFLKEILQTYYPNGLDVYDDKNLQKIRQLLLDLFKCPIQDYSDRYIISRICQLSTLIGRGIWKYNPEQIELSDDLKLKINQYINNYPISAIPIKSVFDKFEEELIEYGIDNKYAFQGILKKYINPEFKTTKDYIYTDDSQTFVEIIASFIKNSKDLVTKELLEKEFPGFSVGTMQRVINTSSVVNMNGYYASIDNFHFSQDEISQLKTELEMIVQDEEVHNTKNIFYRFKVKFNGLFNRIGINHYLQLYYILNKLFDDDFEFLRPFIAKKGIEIQDKETQLVELIVQEGKVSIEQLRDLSNKIGYFMESIMDFVIRNNDELVFLDDKTIVATNKIEIDEEKMAQIDNILDNCMLYYDYKYLDELVKNEEISKIFPKTNKWFLYSIITAYSVKYKIFRTSNVMSRTELLIVKENYDEKQIKDLIKEKSSYIDLEDILDIEDLE